MIFCKSARLIQDLNKLKLFSPTTLFIKGINKVIYRAISASINVIARP